MCAILTEPTEPNHRLVRLGQACQGTFFVAVLRAEDDLENYLKYLLLQSFRAMRQKFTGGLRHKNAETAA